MDRGPTDGRTAFPIIRLALCALLLGGGVGCVTPIDGGRGFAPFYESTPAAPAVAERSGPEFARASDEGDTVHLWPLYSRIEAPERTETRVLWPIFKDEITPKYRRSWALPIFLRSEYLHGDNGETDVDTILLPFFWGHGREHGSYFGAFPLGGTIKGLLGHDRIDFALFPLYARAQDRDRVSHHFLFPIFNYTSGTRVRGGRVWPFFSRYSGYTPEGTLRYRRSSYLWPLIHIHDSDLETDRPTKVRWFFPLYGRIESERLQRWSVLWPFLGKDILPDKEWTSVYFHPLLRFSWHEDELVQYDIYPLYGYKKYKDRERTFLLWPLIGWESQRPNEHYERKSRWFFPFYRHTHTAVSRQVPGEGEQPRRETQIASTRVWPFYRYRAHADGRQEWNLIDPLPFPDPPGFDSFYSRIWRIYREVDDPLEQRRAWELLWGIAGGSRTPEKKSWSVLGGLIGRSDERNAEGTGSETTWRVLYIPF